MAMLEGMKLRREEPDDAAFLKQLFYAVRSPEFAAAGWPEEQMRGFLAIRERMHGNGYSGRTTTAPMSGWSDGSWSGMAGRLGGCILQPNRMRCGL